MGGLVGGAEAKEFRSVDGAGDQLLDLCLIICLHDVSKLRFL